MKKSSIIISVVALIIIGFLVFRKDKESDIATPTPETPTEGEAPVLENRDPEKSQQPDYSYINDEFDFAVTLPGLVATRRESGDPIMKPTIFTFGVGDQSAVPEEKRVPNTMVVYVWRNKAELDLLLINIRPSGKETVNGRVFEKYVVTEGDKTIYRYVTVHNGLAYDVGVSDIRNVSKFFILD